MTQAIRSHGTQLKLGSNTKANTPTYTLIAEVGDISGPELTRETIDVTTHDSANDFDEFITGIKNSGEVSFKINWNPDVTTHDGSAGLWYLYQQGTLRAYQIEDKNANTLTFDAYVTSMSPDYPVNGVVGCDVRLKVSGDVVLA